MNKKTVWIRVSKEMVCPICKKSDWCTLNREINLVNCMRVQSDRVCKSSQGGWLHKIDSNVKPYIPTKKQSFKPIKQMDFHEMWNRWSKLSTPKSLIIFGEKLGIDPMALRLLGCVWSPEHNAWAFPMKDSDERIIGIRLRSETGQKWSCEGSRSGLFIPNEQSYEKREIFVVEGATDVLAGLCLGLPIIGRPSCLGQEGMINEFLTKKRIKNVVIIADNDTAGLMGANRLQQELKVSSCIITLPCKDLREFYNFGGNRQSVESILKNIIWTKK